eukprot:SAG31_NODE_19730_length_593_cov_0.791498_1_plen_197_part_11
MTWTKIQKQYSSNDRSEQFSAEILQAVQADMGLAYVFPSAIDASDSSSSLRPWYLPAVASVPDSAYPQVQWPALSKVVGNEANGHRFWTTFRVVCPRDIDPSDLTVQSKHESSSAWVTCRKTCAPSSPAVTTVQLRSGHGACCGNSTTAPSTSPQIQTVLVELDDIPIPVTNGSTEWFLRLSIPSRLDHEEGFRIHW